MVISAMSLLSDFTKSPQSFAAKYTVLMIEDALPAPLKPTATAGNTQLLAAPSYIFRFSIDANPTASRGALCKIYNDQNAPLCYFLPYKDDSAIAVTLGNAADFFFTSTLSGCSVQAQGPPATPTVIHANRKTIYFQTYQQAAA